MGGTKSSSGGTQPVNMTETTTLGEKSLAQQQLESRLLGLNGQQVAALRSAIQAMQTGDPLALAPQDQTEHALAFNQAKETFGSNAASALGYLQGGRGTALSNTPMSPQAQARMDLGRRDLLGLEASSRLNYAMEAPAARAQIVSSLGAANPGAGVANLGLMAADRYGNRTTRSYGTGMSSSAGSYNNLNDNISLGMRLAGGIGGLAMRGADVYNTWNRPAAPSTPTMPEI